MNQKQSTARLRRLHLVIVDLLHPRKTATWTEKHFYKQITGLWNDRGDSVTPIPLCNQEEWRWRYVFGYSLDDSDKPVYLIWPERTRNNGPLAPRYGQKSEPQPLSNCKLPQSRLGAFLCCLWIGVLSGPPDLRDFRPLTHGTPRENSRSEKAEIEPKSTEVQPVEEVCSESEDSSFEIINVGPFLYLHPKKFHISARCFLEHLQSDTSRSHDFRFVGDFNQADTKLPTVFTDILNELNYSLPSTYPTFRLPNGYSSHLDLFLLQGPDNSMSSSPPKFVTYWPTFHPTGHAVHICKFSRAPPVSPSSDDLVTSQIPSQIFYTPPSHNTIPTESSIIRQLPVLERSLLSLSCPTTPTVKAAIWAWWHSTRQSQTVSTSSHHINILYRKLSRAKGRLIHLPGPSWTWLLTHFPDTPAEGYHIIRDTHYLVSVPLLSDLLVKYSLLHPSQPPGPTRTQFTILPAATWTKCRVAAPKIWAHQGAIKSSDGTICTTTASLDAALRATRSFWQDFPYPFSPCLGYPTQ